MTNLITYKGIIHFDPDNKTKKHITQSDWKRIAMVLFDGDICEYYAWFLKKRYNIVLNKPLRGAHVSIINDSLRDIKTGLNLINDLEVEQIWNSVKNKWDNQEIDITFGTDVRSNSKHWWINVVEESRQDLYKIRKELGLGKTYWGIHLSLGYVNEKYIKHSEYIVDLLTKFGNEYN